MESTSLHTPSDASQPAGAPPFQAVVDLAQEKPHGLRITGVRTGGRHGARVALRGLLARLHSDRAA